MSAEPQPEKPATGTAESVETPSRAFRSLRIRWPEDIALEAKYANQVQVTIGGSEVVLLFAQVLPPSQRQGEALPKSIAEGYIDARPVVQIVMPVEAFLALVPVLKQQAELLEQLISQAIQNEGENEGNAS